MKDKLGIDENLQEKLINTEDRFIKYLILNLKEALKRKKYINKVYLLRL